MRDAIRARVLILAFAVASSLADVGRASETLQATESVLASRDVWPSLKREMDAWVPGDAVPARLLSYPDGDVRAPEEFSCGLAAYFESVRMPVAEVVDTRLLDALLVHPSVSSASLEATILELIDRGGPDHVLAVLADRADLRWELELLRATLEAGSVHLSVANIEADAMPAEDARRALDNLNSRLAAGDGWRTAYRVVADAHPDLEDRRRNPGSFATLVGYEFDGWVGASGLVVSTLRKSDLPMPRITAAVRSGTGGRIYEDAEGTWLYYVHARSR